MIRMAMIRKAILLGLLAASVPAAAQLGLPPLGETVGGTLGPIGGQVGGVVERGLDPVRGVVRGASQLAQMRIDRLGDFVRRNRDSVEFDEDRQPAKRGEALLLDPDPASLQAAEAAGYRLAEQAELEGLGVSYARLLLPEREGLADGIKRLRRLLPGKTVTADQLHFPSGAAAKGDVSAVPQPVEPFSVTLNLFQGPSLPGRFGHPEARWILSRQASEAKQVQDDGRIGLAPSNQDRTGPRPSPGPRGGIVGVIDGGMPASRLVAAQRGFTRGAPRTSGHAAAIASLLAGAGVERIWAADVYGGDPAGGNALAIAQALGWMAGAGVPVVSISLVGPSNPLVQRAVVAAQAKGITVVAAVGNDGAAAPPAFPASYPGVVAVTGVDARGRVLIEAGRAGHLDYAAPGADLSARGENGKAVRLRGTSFAAPLAAARIAAYRKTGAQGRALLTAVDREAVDLGRRGADGSYGRGLLCGGCRQGI